ncbi:hypothetical protein [Clostridium perfringens]|uniref:hypothetical protein n=1 Tax=Clostridium perfringens TaxID=1502 RepID=UPI001A23750E|nr:hypothetical protein [Clostridium perfringens]MBO3339093.1 hypothetical protein [Clostridium perfringens]MBO3427867.1 hypothetical protein [Clostridium perfringens]HAT4343987.1 hypothetical protein [Clostridium perfringens]
MALHFKSVLSSKIIGENRFDPKVFFLEDKLKAFEKSDKFEVLNFGDERIMSNITDGEHAGQKFVDNGILFLKNSSVKEFNISRDDGFFIEEEKHKAQKRSALKKDDLLFTTIGHLGTTAIVPEYLGEANINQNVVKIEVNKEYISPEYLSVYLNSFISKFQINNMFTGNIQKILTYPKIKKIKIIIPKDRNVIDKITNNVKTAIKLDGEAYELIEKAKKILISALNLCDIKIKECDKFNVKVSQLEDIWLPKNYLPKYKETINYFKENFETITLGESFLDIISGCEVGSDNYIEHSEKTVNDIPFIRTSDIFNNEIDMRPDNYISCDIFDEYKQDIIKGDVLFTKDGRIGSIAIVNDNEEKILSSGISRIRVKKNDYDITNEYIFISLLIKEITDYQKNQKTVYASTIPHLRVERLKEFLIPVIDKERINEITNLVKDSMDKKMRKNELLRKSENILIETFLQDKSVSI